MTVDRVFGLVYDEAWEREGGGFELWYSMDEWMDRID